MEFLERSEQTLAGEVGGKMGQEGGIKKRKGDDWILRATLFTEAAKINVQLFRNNLTFPLSVLHWILRSYRPSIYERNFHARHDRRLDFRKFYAPPAVLRHVLERRREEKDFGNEAFHRAVKLIEILRFGVVFYVANKTFFELSQKTKIRRICETKTFRNVRVRIFANVFFAIIIHASSFSHPTHMFVASWMHSCFCFDFSQTAWDKSRVAHHTQIYFL